MTHLDICVVQQNRLTQSQSIVSLGHIQIAFETSETRIADTVFDA